MYLVESASNCGEQNGSRCPFELPYVAQEDAPRASQPRPETVAMSVLQREKHQQTQDRVADDMAALAQNPVHCEYKRRINTTEDCLCNSIHQAESVRSRGIIRGFQSNDDKPYCYRPPIAKEVADRGL